MVVLSPPHNNINVDAKAKRTKMPPVDSETSKKLKLFSNKRRGQR
jgi:hypothetical protein